MSSADVYGKVREIELPLTEDSPLQPVSPYAASKVAADYLGLQAWLGRGPPVLRVRAFNHLGPGQIRQVRGRRAGQPHRPQRAATAATS